MVTERTYYSTEAEERARRETLMAVGTAMAVGIGLGAGLMMLVTPPESRKRMRQKVTHAIDRGVEAGREGIAQVTDMAEEQAKDFSKATRHTIRRSRKAADNLFNDATGSVRGFFRPRRRRLFGR